MIDHVKGACHISSPHLTGWMDRIMFFWGRMRDCTIHHIFRSQNIQADCLSKKGLILDSGSWSMMVIDGEFSCFIQDFSIPGFWVSFVFKSASLSSSFFASFSISWLQVVLIHNLFFNMCLVMWCSFILRLLALIMDWGFWLPRPWEFLFLQVFLSHISRSASYFWALLYYLNLLYWLNIILWCFFLSKKINKIKIKLN